jgi:hypothetical protein
MAVGSIARQDVPQQRLACRSVLDKTMSRELQACSTEIARTSTQPLLAQCAAVAPSSDTIYFLMTYGSVAVMPGACGQTLLLAVRYGKRYYGPYGHDTALGEMGLARLRRTCSSSS